MKFRYERAPFSVKIPLQIHVQTEPPEGTSTSEDASKAPTTFTEVSLEQGESLAEAMYHLTLHQHPHLLPPHLQDRIHQALSDAIEQQLQQNYQRVQREVLEGLSEEQRDRNLGRMVRRYQQMYSKFADRNEPPPFEAVFSKLVSSNDRAFDVLLLLEQTYLRHLAKLLRKQQTELEQLQVKQEKEVTLVVGSDGRRRRELEFTGIPERHKEEMNAFRRTWARRVQELKLAQRQEFRRRTLELYRLHKAKQPYNNLQWVQDLQALVPSPTLDSPVHTVLSSGRASPPVVIKEDPLFLQKVLNLKDMGFTEEQARAALVLCNDNLDSAVNMLLEDPDHVQRAIARGAGLPKLEVSPEKEESWSPFNFIEQRTQGNPSTKTNLQKFGSWLDKAVDRAKARIDDLIDDDSPIRTSPVELPSPDFQHMTESFTISLGAQVRYTQNLRLIVSGLKELYMPPTFASATALRAQTYATLCGNNLFAIVVLVTPSEWESYLSGQSANKDLFRYCYENTELFFDGIQTQLMEAEKELREEDGSFRKVKEGDVFVSKHSNLTSIHMVFHLVMDEPTMHSVVSQRSPVMQGLRSILLTCFRADVKHISIPLLLTSDDVPKPVLKRTTSKNNLLRTSPSLSSLFNGGSSQQASSSTESSPIRSVNDEEITPAKITRRAEMILKCIKGFLLECSRSYGRRGRSGKAFGTGGDDIAYASENTSTVQFVLPPSVASDPLFESLKTMIRTIFRAA